jgi:hypothetical protein
MLVSSKLVKLICLLNNLSSIGPSDSKNYFIQFSKGFADYSHNFAISLPLLLFEMITFETDMR